MILRPYKSSDISDIVSLLNRCLHADPLTSDIFQQKVLLDINFDPNLALVAQVDSLIVGFALSMTRKFPLENAAPDFDRGWITLIAVDEHFRRNGIGTELVARLEELFISQHRRLVYISSYAPNYFIPGIDVNAYPDAMEFFREMKYVEVSKPLSMDANLVALQVPNWVSVKEHDIADSGVSVETFRPELILPLLDFLKAEFPGDWQRFARDTMVRITTGEYRSDNIWIAHERGRVIGYCQHDNTGRFGPFGVSSAERGRGIGAVLLFKCLSCMRAKGFHNAWFLWTSDEVARLYSQAGFVQSRRFALLKKELLNTQE